MSSQHTKKTKYAHCSLDFIVMDALLCYLFSFPSSYHRCYDLFLLVSHTPSHKDTSLKVTVQDSDNWVNMFLFSVQSFLSLPPCIPKCCRQIQWLIQQSITIKVMTTVVMMTMIKMIMMMMIIFVWNYYVCYICLNFNYNLNFKHIPILTFKKPKVSCWSGFNQCLLKILSLYQQLPFSACISENMKM